MNKRNSETRYEIYEEEGKIISRHIEDTVLTDNKDIDSMLEELDRQIAMFENTLSDLQKTIQELKNQRHALIDFKSTKMAK